jgi:hypothetical protein
MEEMVVYCDITDETKVWVRPISMWGEEVIVGGKKQPRFRFLASSLDEMDVRPTFSLIEAIKDNMEQFRHNGEYNTLRFYHKPTSDILEVDEGLLTLLEGGGNVSGFSPERLVSAEKVMDREEEYLPLPDDVNEYDQMEHFIEELPIYWRGDLERAIRGKGAFRRFRFKEAVARLGVLEDWNRYLTAAYRREARMWCDVNGIIWWKDLI